MDKVKKIAKKVAFITSIVIGAVLALFGGIGFLTKAGDGFSSICVVLGAVFILVPIFKRKSELKAALAEELKKKEAVKKAEEEARKREEQERIAAEKEKEFVERLESIPKIELEAGEKNKRDYKLCPEFYFPSVTPKTNTEKICNFVVVDCETSGLSHKSCEVVEFSAIRFRRWEPEEKITTLCRAVRGIGDSASEVNGITDEMVEEYPTFTEFSKSINEFIGNDIIVGHNLSFDLPFLFVGGVDITEDRKYYDTLVVARKHLTKQSKYTTYGYDVDNFKLSTLCRYYGIPYYGAHRSEADAYVTGMLFKKLVEDIQS